MNRLGLTVTLLAVCLVLTAKSVTPIVHAQTTATSVETFTPEVPLPGLFEGSQTADDTLLSRYIRAIYVYFIWVVGIIATVMVIYGGIRWVGAAGNPGRIKEARDIIDNAVIGVIIALTSVVLLNIINPKLTKLAIPKLGSLTKQYFDGAAVKTICPYTKTLEDNVACSQIKKVGTTTDRNGQTVDAYCMGVAGPYGTNLPGNPIHLYPERRVCQIAQNAISGYYQPSGDCIIDVPIASVPGETRFTSVTHGTVTDLPFGLSFACGHVSPIDHVPGTPFAPDTQWRVGYSCRSTGAEFMQLPMCYLVGTKAITSEAWVDGGQAQNMFCPAVS